ncbi:ABC-2 transporter permease [Hamadaea sp. NPDC051192]|uniref:ABC-2 transporter permease n=1 Tax=Hamadaea sp. NPDC051192 TaxID=3154940 RepID=UPI0034442AB2
MKAVARMAALHMRTVAPFQSQFFLVFGVAALIDARSPTVVAPALAVLLAPYLAVQPFQIAEKADLDTLYAVLPAPRHAVLRAYYVWAMASYAATVVVGTLLAYVFARIEGVAFGGRSLVTMLVLSWALFAVNIAIQFPILIRFGYARVSVLATTLPLALVMLAAYKLHLTVASIQVWLPLLGVAGVVAFVASATLAPRLRKAV